MNLAAGSRKLLAETLGNATRMAFMTEAHGRYEIMSGPMAGAWAANAIRHKTVIAKATGILGGRDHEPQGRAGPDGAQLA